MKPNKPSKKFSPGSKEAGEAGCKCPVIDNHYGKGVPVSGSKYPKRLQGERAFWYSDTCEYHKSNLSNK